MITPICSKSYRQLVASQSKNTETDEELMAKVMVDSDVALKILMWRYVDQCRRCALRVVRNLDQAEEISYETFARVWEHRRSYDVTRSLFRTWMFTINRRLALNQLRNTRRRPTYTFEDADAARMINWASHSMSTPEAIVAQQDFCEKAFRAVKRLPAHYALVLAHYAQQMSCDDVGRQLHLPPGTVRSRMKRGREILNKMDIVGELRTA